MMMNRTYIGAIMSAVWLACAPVCAQQISETQVQAIEQEALNKKMNLKKLQAQSVQLSLELAKMNKTLIEAAQKLQEEEEAPCSAGPLPLQTPKTIMTTEHQFPHPGKIGEMQDEVRI